MRSDLAVAPASDQPSLVGPALCEGKTELFFAPPGERTGRRLKREALARSYCAVCDNQKICQELGRQNREHGIWGGENDEERAASGFPPRSPHRRAVLLAARGNVTAEAS